MRRVVFPLEEKSMGVFLESFLPRIIPSLDFVCLGHEGKRDLEKSIPRKLKAWPGVDFVVLRDNDNAHCRSIKARLRSLCARGGRPETLVRLACQELEAWYLGALEAIEAAYSKKDLASLARKAKFRDPDALANPSRIMSELVPEFRKIDGARRMGSAIPAARNGSSSRSFQVFVAGVARLAGR